MSTSTDNRPLNVAPQRLCKIVVLISGSGSNLQTFIDRAGSGELQAEIVAVISNKADVQGLTRASTAGISTDVIDHRRFETRESFDAQLMRQIDHYQPDLVILAGFMRILTPGFVKHYLGRLLNIHPSLLPKYPGLHTHQRAIDAGDREAGATVHFVTEQLDGGPAIIQAAVPIEEKDDAKLLAKRVLTVEHVIYTQAAQWFAQGKLQLDGNHVLFNNEKLPISGQPFRQ